MSLEHERVLVVNKRRQAVGEMPMGQALCDVFRGQKMAIDTETMMAVTWDEWIKLPVREGDRTISTTRGAYRMPTVVCAFTFAKMPVKRIAYAGGRGVAERDGRVCQLTGEHAPNGSVDHWVPKKHGGKDTFENTLWVKRELNQKKGSMLPAEFVKKTGLKPRRKLKAPEPVEMWRHIRPRPDRPEWAYFLANG